MINDCNCVAVLVTTKALQRLLCARLDQGLVPIHSEISEA